jgi:protein subunit release factor B
LQTRRVCLEPPHHDTVKRSSPAANDRVKRSGVRARHDPTGSKSEQARRQTRGQERLHLTHDAISLGEHERRQRGRRPAALQGALHSEQRRIDQTPRRRTARYDEARTDGVAHAALGETGKAAGG